MKFKNGLNLQKWGTVLLKLFEIIWKTIDWKLIWKLTIISGLHFNRTSRISCEKCDEKCYDHW